ncbi:hypothetical protein EIP91_006477 [Steccherinum ochraceum]|uniref:SET domain-containing protein n=1 Tax=Steccherinum ochraceum TaxID=92696 RepID=A0A4R0RLV5_9APHY|nr:hypothetical protein EIP91_006477 [Steccherinum ochraceum]
MSIDPLKESITEIYIAVNGCSAIFGPMSKSSYDHQLWRSLLSWLETKHGMKTDSEHLRVECRNAPGSGKGLFLLKDCSRSSLLFKIPARALINIKTLSPFYPAAVGPNGNLELSAVQMISLHLLLHKPSDEDGSISLDPTFGPYISTMPRDFSSHPCWWLVKQRMGRTEVHEDRLLESLPPSVMRELKLLSEKFWKDWSAVCDYIRARPKILQKATHRLTADDLTSRAHPAVLDYLWAWLNVNTRCIHYRLSPSTSSPENLTLCPILDFANHRPGPSDIIPTSNPYKLGGDFTFTASSEHALRLEEGERDKEVFLRYGGHANRVLFVEYGFVNLGNSEGVEGEGSGEVDVQDVVEDLVFGSADAEVVKRARDVLELEGYWGDWTMHASPSPAHPSYRLITALRLFHCLEHGLASQHSLDGKAHTTADTLVEAWRRVIQGVAEQISDDNEARWRTSVERVCQEVIRRAERSMKTVEQLSELKVSDSTPEWFEWMQGNIRLLWREELEVATQVSHSIQNDEEF